MVNKPQITIRHIKHFRDHIKTHKQPNQPSTETISPKHPQVRQVNNSAGSAQTV